jgi:hypothetical protein
MLSSLLATVILVLVSGPALGIESGHRLRGDEARVTFWFSDPYDSCYEYELWTSFLVGEVMPLAPGSRPQDESRVYAIVNLSNICTGESTGLEGVASIEPNQVQFVRLESFEVENVYVEVSSEDGDWMSFSFDVSFTRTGEKVHGGYVEEEQFQVERWAEAAAEGTFSWNEVFTFPAEPGQAELVYLTQIGTPRP